MTASDDQVLARLREAVNVLRDVRAERDALLAKRDEPIAVIGLGCRFPGGAGEPEAYFRALESGVDAVREIPPDRWPAEAIPGSKPEARWAALLDGIEGFDAAFFGISPREAGSLDPQQRLLLEVVWEALEDAGQRPDALAGTAAGVFVGISSLDYQHRLIARGAEQFDAYSATGNLLSTAAGRVSYTFGFQGPAMSIDTACSSSLVAVCLACQSLRASESDLAMAGGVNLLLSPSTMALLAMTQALSPDGRCKTLDARANGFVRGEGAGIVVLKRLADAERDGDRVRAVIRGWAVNQDGRSTGLTTPNVLSQEALLRRALERARVSPGEIGYLEMHGTGTPLGDPIEVDALRAVLGAARADGSTCVLGAVKTNIGHLEPAAGAAGLIKAILALEHEVIPPNLHFRRINPRIALEGTPFVVPIERVAWRRGDRRRVAGVSSFGISGTNAHVIVEEAPLPKEGEAPASRGGSYHLLPLSAKSPAALVALARAYAEHVMTLRDDDELRDVAYAASLRRTHHEHRLAVAGRTRRELAEALSTFARNEEGTGIAGGQGAQRGPLKVIFVFPGQGSQWVGMGRALLAEEAVFRAAIEACDRVIAREAGFSVLTEIAADERASRLANVEVVQPMLFAMGVALAALWRSWGVDPSAVVGYSMGEIAAAHVAGILSLEDAAKVICRRTRLLRRVCGRGAMALVELSMPDAEKVVSGYRDQLSVAASNGPRSTVLSGDRATLEEVLGALEGRGIFCRRVNVDFASHSSQVDPILDDLRVALADVRPMAARLTMWSTVTGAPVSGLELDGSYWAKNLRAPVLFASVSRGIVADGPALLAELSPHPILLPGVAESLRERDVAVVVSMRRDSPERRSMLEALGEAYMRGFDVRFQALHAAGGHVVALPGYPWQRERHWIDGAFLRRRGVIPSDSGAHPLLGEPFVPASHPEAHYWERSMSADAPAYLADHRVKGAVVFPAAGCVELALEAATAVFGQGEFVLEDLSFERMMTLDRSKVERVQVSLLEEGGSRGVIEVVSRAQDGREWTRHMRARAQVVAEDAAEAREPPQRTRERCTAEIDGAQHYAHMDARQLAYGPAFRSVEHIWVGTGVALSWVRLPGEAGDPSSYQVHPAFLDGCFQITAALLGADDRGATYVPVGIDRVRLRRTLSRAGWVRVRYADPAGSMDRVDLDVVDDSGGPLLEVRGLRLQKLTHATMRDAFAGCAYGVTWRRHDIAPQSSRPASRSSRPPKLEGTWLVFMDQGGIGAGLAARLRQRGYMCVEVAAGSRFERRAPGRYAIDPARTEDYQRLFREAASADQVISGVVHLWSLDAAPWADTTVETLLADVRRGSLSVLCLVRELVWQGFRDPPRLLLVTRGAVAAGGDASLVGPSQSPLWGLGRTIVMEHPDITCTRVDLPPAPRQDDVAALARELWSADNEDQVALRDGCRMVAQLERSDVEPGVTRPLHADGSYLITGGLGSLGLAAAGWMVAQGAQHIALMGRSAPLPAALAAVHALEDEGASVLLLRGDVSRPADVEAAIAQVGRQMPRLRGVVHAAGVLDDRTLQEMTVEQFWPPIRPKVLGAWNLHAATSGMALDFFIMYSSGATLLGSPGQGNYAAANAFLDALAHRRSALGLPAMSIQWGPFSGGGMVAAQQVRKRRLTLQGIETFTPEEGVELLGRMVARPRVEVGLARLSVRKLTDYYPHMVSSSFFADLRKDEARAGASIQGDAGFREALAAKPLGERLDAMARHVVEHLGRVLGLPPERIDASAPFRSHGLDSLMSLEVKNGLEVSLGLLLSASLLYTYPTALALAAHLLDELQLPDAAPAATITLPPLQERRVQEVDEDTAAAMLNERLRALEDLLK